ncbi:hypothetical protein C6499_22770 [Candidatus Poribacteria bacterium]|nr:MAG: hypothetical protein C6499_22770 [Candidatus Poribacteria bacterium]
MDKQGHLIKTPQELLIEPAPRKVTIREYPSPDYQRRWQIEKEQREQAQNSIKPKPRRKRGRKFRSR